VTGHSLGGALATLFGFAAAAEPDTAIPKPVTVVSFASPYVGDESFRSAHQVLESTGRLRHVRVTAHKDLIPLVPKVAFKWNVFDVKAGVGSLFKHVGMNLRLYEGDTPFEVLYPAVRTGKWTSCYEEWSRGWEQTLWTNWTWKATDYFGKYHSLREYDRRLRANKPSLQSLQINDCYARRDIVGYLVPQF
jgi:Lipase (class 3)